MTGVAERTRSQDRRRPTWAAMDSEAEACFRRASAIPASAVGGAGGARPRVRVWEAGPSRPPGIVVVSDDDEDDGAQSSGCGAGGGSIGSPLESDSVNVATETPSKASQRIKEESLEEESLSSSDPRVVVVESDSEGGDGSGSGSGSGRKGIVEDDASGEGAAQENDDAEEDVEAQQAHEHLQIDREDSELGHSSRRREIPKVHYWMKTSCVAWRTRSQVGKQNRVSYATYFEGPELEDTDDEEEQEEEDEEEDESYHMTDNENNDGEELVSDGSTEVARPHSESELNKRKRKLGRPCLDVNVSDLELNLGSSSSSEEDEKSGRRKEVRMDVDWREEGRMQGRSRSGKTNKRKHAKALEDYNIYKLLVETISNNMEKLPRDLSPPKDRSSPTQESPYGHEDPLPLIFSFEDEDHKLVEKDEYEKALDELWADFEFAMEAANVGIYHADESQTEEINILEAQSHPSDLCSQGKHQFILDEQIGIKCQFCSLVNLEIRNILPPWATHIGESSTRNNFAKLDSTFTFNDLFQTAESYDNQGFNGVLKGTVWDLIPGIKTTMYQHQQEAFEFIWKNLAGGIHLDELKSVAKSDSVGGCVISHAPGTGKTRLTIVFIQTYMKVFPDCRPIIVAPRGMLCNWEKEFQKWETFLPIHNLNTLEYSGQEDNVARQLVGNRNKNLIRIVKLYSWAKGNSILGISYGLLKKFVADKSNGSQVCDILLEKPGLLILDEGHTPRNERSLIWKVLTKVKTEKRIILSGTPFQNNFLELYNILSLVRPKFAERFSTKLVKKRCRRRLEFIKDKEQDIATKKNEGKEIWTSMTNHVTNENAEEVRSVLKPFVHIHNGDILKTLPGLRECVIVLDPLPLQRKIIEKVQHIRSNGNFENEYIVSLAAIHPSLVTHIDFSREEESLIDKNLLEELKSNPYEGVKTKFVLEVVRLCNVLKEKVLVFSQYIQPLAMIKDQLKKSLNWSLGKEVLQMDGKVRTEVRQDAIDVFNDMESEARVLLASTKAFCEGISLTGASRVIMLDVVWNPAVGRQAISRAHRIGQKNVVYTYNLITSGTREGEKYDKQARKDKMSKLVFSPDHFTDFKDCLSQAEEKHPSRLISEDKILEEMTDRLKDMFIQIYYPPKECAES